MSSTRLPRGVVLAVWGGSWLFPLVSWAADAAFHAEVLRLAEPYLKQQLVVGMTIGVLRNGEEECFGVGKLRADASTAPDGDTVYEIGSTTKVFTGVLLADAVVQGRVKLDQPAQELLPEGVTMPSREGARAITLQDLSTHVSGLPRLPDNFAITNAENPYATYTAKDLRAFLNGHKLTRAPGEKAEYSNLAQGLLGQLLARQAKANYEQLVVERIAKPLQMKDTSVTLNESQQKRLATPHTADRSPAKNWDLPTLAGAGALRSTARDMLRFATANLSPPPDDLGKALELAWEVHQPPLAEADFAMGLGWHVARDGQTRWHNGQTGGYHACLFVNRPLKVAVVLLTNKHGDGRSRRPGRTDCPARRRDEGRAAEI